MTPVFSYDVFLAYSRSDVERVRSLASRLKTAGLRVWFDEWEAPTESVSDAIEQGLEKSSVVILCVSQQALGPDWHLLQSQTLRHRDPLDESRRFIPLCLDNTPLNESLRQFIAVEWKEGSLEELSLLVNICKGIYENQKANHATAGSRKKSAPQGAAVHCVALSADGSRVASGGGDRSIRIWDFESGTYLKTIPSNSGPIKSLALSTDGKVAVAGHHSGTIRVWDIESEKCLRVINGHVGPIYGLALSPDGEFVLSASEDTTIKLWHLASGECMRVLRGHNDHVRGVAFSPDGRHALSCGSTKDRFVRMWDIESGECVSALSGHATGVNCVAFSPDGNCGFSGSGDKSIRFWDLSSKRCLKIFEGHDGSVRSLAVSADGRTLVSGSSDWTIRVWDIATGYCLKILEGHHGRVGGVAISSDGRRAVSCSTDTSLQFWDVKNARSQRPSLDSQYANAKVLLIGDTGAGKTSLCHRLVHRNWTPSDSTVGAWSTQWKLPSLMNSAELEREIWLWDFGGQADQRLINQLFMDQTSLVVLVFNPQREDLFESLAQWDRDMAKAARRPFTKILAAARIDVGGFRLGRTAVELFASENAFSALLETSAKTGEGCDKLRDEIIKCIQWERIPWRSSPALFKHLKDEIIRLKDEKIVLLRFTELRQQLEFRLSATRFGDDELRAAIALLVGPCVVWELGFGSFILLQPEQINAYGQAMVQTVCADPLETGCLFEEKLLRGDLIFKSGIRMSNIEDERILLLALHQTVLERGLCLREATDRGHLLVFPSYYRRERPSLENHPAVLVTYLFRGPIDEIYATLVVRLHHTSAFEKDQLWRNAADFKTNCGRRVGIKLERKEDGLGELELYCDLEIPLEEIVIFSKYIHEHLLSRGSDVSRQRHYVCKCGEPVENRRRAMERLQSGKKDILCVNCEERVPLWDQLEMRFAAAETREAVRKLEEESQIVLDSESKERALVGEVISAVALAGQIAREFTVSDHGIDMEIEFKRENGEASGHRIYLQLKSGDSYLRKRKRDGKEIFEVQERHSRYWREQAYPVWLIVRSSRGEVRWMDISASLNREIVNTAKSVRQVVFEGEPFSANSVWKLRKRLLGSD